MTDTAIIFLLVKYFELAVFFYYGYRLSKVRQNMKFWLSALILIMIFALIEGLRWDRGADYGFYFRRYNDINTWIPVDDSNNPVFTIICFFLKKIGASFSFFLVVQCALLMFSCVFFLKKYRESSLFMLPLFLVTTLSNEIFIRWWFAFSFLLIGFCLYLSGRYIWAFCLILCSFFTHWGIIGIIPILLLVPIIDKINVSPIIITFFYVISLFFISITDFSTLIKVSDLIMGSQLSQGNEVMSDYLNTTEVLINGDFGSLGIVKKSFSARIKNLLIYLPIIFYSPKYMKRIPYGMAFYNLLALGVIFAPIFDQVELLGRYSNILLFFFCIVSGNTLYQIFNVEKSKLNGKIVFLLISYIICFYSIINAPFVRLDNEMLFVWNR